MHGPKLNADSRKPPYAQRFEVESCEAK